MRCLNVYEQSYVPYFVLLLEAKD